MAIPTTNKTLYNPALSRAVSSVVANYYPMIGSIPYQPIASETFKVRRLTGLGGTQWVAEGDTLSTAKNAPAWDNVTYTVKRQVADIELDTYQIDGALSAGESLLARAVQAKASAVADALGSVVYNGGKISGAYSTVQVNPLRSLVDASNVVDGAKGELSFEMLDALLLKVRAKGGSVDFITLGEGLYLDYQTLWRSLGGTAPEAVWINPYTNEQRTVIAYNGIPVFATNQLTQVEESDGTVNTDDDYDATDPNDAGTAVFGSVYAGTFDSGIEGDGIAFKYFAQTQAGQDAQGMTFRAGGMMEAKAQDFWRMEQRLELVTHHKHAVARLKGVKRAS